MEQQAQRSTRPRRNKMQVLELLEQFEKSGSSVTAFCKQNNVGVQIFYRWRGRYKKESAFAGEVGFAPVDIVSDSSPALFAEVKGIRIFQPVSASFLKELLQ